MATSTLGSGTLVLAGTTSGTTTVTATAVAGTTTLTLPAATDTLVGKATTDTLTNKTLTTPSVSSPTISDGTANGVAYLNGSKVLTTGSALTFDGTNFVNTAGYLGTTQSGAASSYFIAKNSVATSGVVFGAHSSGAGYIDVINNNPLFFAVNDTEQMRLTSTGLGVGTSSPAVKLDVAGVARTQNTANADGVTIKRTNNANANGALNFTGSDDVVDAAIAMATDVADALTIRTAGTERARIGSGGGISIFSATTANDTIDSCNNQAAGTTYSTFIGRHSATTISTGTVSCRIYTNGNIINTNNSYGQISDIKLKENIVDATPKLEKLSQVRVVNFNFIGDQQKQLGVVAQELEQVFPGMIDESPDKDAEGNDLGTTTKSVKYSVFVPMLIKALQEQQALITQLTARITALESA